MQLKEVLDLEIVKTQLQVPIGIMLKLPVDFPMKASRWFEDICPSIDMYLMTFTGVALTSTEVQYIPSGSYERVADFVEEDFPDEPLYKKTVIWYLVVDKLLGYASDKLREMEIERLNKQN